MSMQADLRNPELGYFDEGMNLMDEPVYAPACRPFMEATTLPPVAYRSKAFFELENEKIWTRSWVAIGLLQQIPRPGDLLPFTLGFHGVHVQRNADGSISARMNRHQHGGCRFVPEQCRTGAQTKCSITSCNYTRDADAMSAGENGENTADMFKFVGLVPERLMPVRCETYGPFIFINLDPECEPLPDQLGDFPHAMGPDASTFGLAKKQWLDFRCNWKIMGAAIASDNQTDSTWRDPTVRDPATFVEAGMAAPPLSGGTRILWLFPNLLLVVGSGQCAVVLLQATAMDKCLCRVFLLAADPASSSSSANFDRWLGFLRAAGSVAEEQHRQLAWLGTSLRPGTRADEPQIEANRCAHALNRFLASRIQIQHRYYWNAPIMDAAMLTRAAQR